MIFDVFDDNPCSTPRERALRGVTRDNGMITIIDYGMGNLRSVQKAFERLGVEATITADPALVANADKVVLPGVGAIADMIAELNRAGMKEVVVETIRANKPFLGVCLGFQALFDWSEENGGTECLGIFPGSVKRFPESPKYVVPHMGWNDLTFHMPDDPISKGLSDGAYVYFVHSFRADTEPSCLVADTTYGIKIPALVRSPVLPVYGAQFHPEKSHDTGMRILSNFNEICKGNHV